jgi:hypothetical protein
MKMFPGWGPWLVRSMQVAIYNLKDGWSDVTSVANNLQDKEWEALEKYGAEEAAEGLDKVAAGAMFVEELLNMLFIESFRKLMNGELLTQREFHAMLAINALPNVAQLCGVTEEGEFRTHQLMHYNGGEDGPRGTIMTDAYKAARRRSGVRPFEIRPIQPEEVCRDRLSEEQKQFFRRHFPSEFMRMKS